LAILNAEQRLSRSPRNTRRKENVQWREAWSSG
jgi:hypothetical protein